MLNDLEPDALTRILRPTALVALVLGGVGFVVALVLNSPLAAVGIAFGIGAAILNVRVLGNGVLRVQTNADTSQNKVVRRLLRTNSAARLVVITAVVIGLMLLAPPLGIGMGVGLVIFQICFVINAGRVIRTTRVV